MVLPESKITGIVGGKDMTIRMNTIEQINNEASEDKDVEELLHEHIEKIKKKKINSFGQIHNLYRVLNNMTNNHKGQKFFTFAELGYYEGNQNVVHAEDRRKVLSKSLKAKLIREVKLPETLHWRRNYKDMDIHEIMHSPHTKKSLEKLKKSKYYTITDEGRRVYNNLKEVLSMLD